MKNLITQWRNMKKPCLKYGILIVVLALDVSCGVIQLNPATTTPEDPVCARPGFEDSFICAKLQELGVEYAETARDIILDANDIAILSDAYTVSQARAVCQKLRGYLDLTEITYTAFFENVMQDTSKAKRLSSVLTRRFAPLKSVEIIRASDRNLLLYAIEAVEENL